MIQARTLQGFNDYLPHEMTLRQHVKDVLAKIFQKYGYGQLETPALEYADILMGKYGEEEKLMYTFKDRGDREIALRYDQTVPLARVVAEHANDIAFPFKRYEINRVWRADAARKGRKREFYQCDVDIIGTNDVLADAEMVQVAHECFKALGLKDHVIFINNRKITSGFVKSLGILEEKHIEVFRSMDKFDKVGLEGVEKELKERGVPEKAISKILEYVKLDCRTLTGSGKRLPLSSLTGSEPLASADESESPAYKMLLTLKNMLEHSEEALKGIAELERIHTILQNSEIPEKNYEISPRLVRGLDYYTGPIFEVIVPVFGNVSLAGGGRYDELCGVFGKNDVSGTGISIGFEPVCAALEELNLGPKQTAPAKVLVSVFSEELLEHSLKIAHNLRENGIPTLLYPETDAKLAKQFKYADKLNIPYTLVIGPEEAEKDEAVLKNMKTGEQEIMKKDTIYDFL